MYNDNDISESLPLSKLCESTAAEAANDRQMTEKECRRKAENGKRTTGGRRPRSDPHRGPQEPHRKHTDKQARPTG